MKPDFEYVSEPIRAHAVVDRNITSREQLFSAIAEGLLFPSYFGRNWDALFDSLRRLEGFEGPEAVLYHAELPDIPPRELDIYIAILRGVLDERRLDLLPRLRVVFESRDRPAVNRILTHLRERDSN